MNLVFFFNVVLSFGARLVALEGWTALLGYLGAVVLLVAGCTFPYNRKIGIGKGWPVGNAILASVLMGLNSALCCGVVGYVVMQMIASNEMKRYGLKSGFLGLGRQLGKRPSNKCARQVRRRRSRIFPRNET